MVEIRIVGAADFTQVQTQLRALQKQTAILNAELERTGIAAAGVNPKGFQQMQAAMSASSATFRAAASSSGQFYTEQLRLNSATDTFTKSLIKQKLSFMDIIKQRRIATQAYREQVKLQNMFVRESPAMARGGKGMFDIAVPRQMSSELNTVGEKFRWINAMIASGSTKMINFGKNTQWAGRQLMVGFTVPTIAFGAATGVLAFNIDKQMTRIKKVYDTATIAVKGDASSMAAANLELAQVTKDAWATAEDAAKNYGASASDTLKVQADLAATGLKGVALQQSTAEVMRIATLGELDYNAATTATIALQTAFKLSTSQLADAFNFMNATENATSLSIQDIVEATPRAATAMSQLGVSVEQMTVMLTAMKESGVDAAEAANALKSATGTILAPSPSADAFIQQISNGTVQVTKLAKESGGNLYVALHNLYDQMTGLSDLQKQQILVKLFGKYQFNRVSALVRNLGDAFTGTANQTKKAMDLMNQSTEQWANTADIELSKITESASGKFKIALEQIKMSLADVGKPFLEAGTQILGVIGKMVSAFNKLPDSVKSKIAWGAIFAAMVGPLVMLVGLSANFLGTILKFGNALAALGRTTGIVTKETKAMELAALSAKNGWSQETSAVMALTEQLRILTESEIAAREAVQPLPMQLTRQEQLQQEYLNRNKINAAQLTGAQQAQSSQLNILEMLKQEFLMQKELSAQKALADADELARRTKIHAQMVAQYEEEFMLLQKTSSGGYYGVNPKGAKSFITEEQARINAQTMAQETAAVRMLRLEQEALGQEIMKIIGYKELSGRIGIDVTKAEMAIIQEEAIAIDQASGAQQRLNVYRELGVAQIEAETAALAELAAAEAYATEKMAAEQMTLTSGAGLEAKARGKTSRYLAGSAISMGLMTAGMIAMSQSSNDLVDSLGKIAMFAGLGGMFGSWGLGIGAAIGGVMALSEHLKKVYAESVASEQALTNSTELWANQADKVLRKFQAIQQASVININPVGVSDAESYTNALNRWQDKNMSKTLDSFSSLSDTKKEAFIIDKFIDLQNRVGLSAQQAGVEIQAMMVASGDSFTKAEIEAGKLLGTIGSIADNKTNLSLQLGARINLIDTTNPDTMYDTAKAVAESFTEAFQNATTPAQAQGLVDQLFNSENSLFSAAVKKLTPSTQKQFEKLGINSVEAFNKAQDAGKINWGDQQLNGKNPTDWMRDDLALANQYQMVLAQVIAESSGLGDGWSDLGGVMDTVLYKSKLNTEEQNKALAIGIATAGRLGSAFDNNNETLTLTNLNTIAANMNLQQGTTIAETLNNILNGVPIALDEATTSAGNLGNALSQALSGGFRFSGKDRLKMLQQGMSGLIGEMASNASDIFSEKMNASIDALTKSWDNRIKHQQEVDDRATKHLDNVWEHRKKRVTAAYQAQIDGIQKTIDAETKQEDLRQKMFEAEMTRLDRLAEMANTNIDFNVAVNSGNLDEAAKIQTNAMATWQGWNLQDASSASKDAADARQQKLEDRIKALENERDAELADMDKRETQEKNHLARVQQLRMDSLKEQQSAEIDARKKAWDLDKKSFDSRLDLFKAFTGRNMKDLKAWMDQTGFAYSDFGDSTLKPMGLSWSQYFRDKLKDQIRLAGTQIASDNMWEAMAGQEAAAVLKGFGFSNMQQLAHFIKTGKMPKNPPTDTNTTNSSGDDHRHPVVAHHEGGMVGSAKNSRKGIAPTSGMHPSEQMILAQKGEYIVNSKAAARNKGVLDSINMGGMGSPALLSSMAGPMFMAGMQSAIGLAYRKGQRDRASSAPGTGVSAAGYKAGIGGYHRPVIGGTPGPIHDSYTGFPAVDVAIPKGSNLYAPGDGRITRSEDIAGPLASDQYNGDGPYGSYGRVIQMVLKNGVEVLFAHLSERFVNVGAQVLGGAIIAATGSTGNSSGPHLHFGSDDGHPEAFFKQGGKVKGTGHALVHDGETVLNKGHSAKFEAGMQTFSELEPGTFDPLTPGSQLIIDRIDRLTKNLASPNGTTSSGDTVKTGTYNVDWKTSLASTPPALKKLMGLADVLSLQEVYGARTSLIKKVLTDNGWGMSQYKDDSVVAYNKGKYSLEGSGNQGMNPGMTNGAHHQNRNAAWALLKGAAGEFYQMSAHTNPMFGQKKAGGRNYDIQRKQYGTLTDMVREFAKRAPVILGGDLNWELERPGGIPIADLTSVMAGHPGGLNGLHTHSGGGDVDHIMFGPGSKNIKSHIVGGLPSDHNALLSEIQLPQLKTGGFTMSDGIAKLHNEETVLTKPLSKDLMDGLGNLANGSGTQYNLKVYASPGMSEDALIRATFREADRRQKRKPRSRKE